MHVFAGFSLIYVVTVNIKDGGWTDNGSFFGFIQSAGL